MRPRLLTGMSFAMWGLLGGCGRIYLPPDPATFPTRRGFHFVAVGAPDARLRIHVERGAVRDGDLNALEVALNDRHAQAHAWLGLPWDGTPARCFVMATPERVRDLLDIRWRSEVDGKAFPAQATLVGTPDALSRYAHEFTHVVAQRAWGTAPAWVSEGVAVASDGQWFDQDLQACARTLKAEGRLLPLATLAGDFPRHPTRQTYPQAGSLVAYLKQTHGLGAVKQVWQGGLKALPQATGQSLAAFEAAWLASLAPDLPKRP